MTMNNRDAILLSRLLAVFAIVIAGCGGPPNNNPLLDDARVTLRMASSDSAVVARAAETLDRAEVSLQRGESLLEEGGDPEDVEHYAYLTTQYVAIAEEQTTLRRLEADIENAESERQQAQIAARELEATRAQQEAEAERLEAELAREQADVAREETDEALEEARILEERVRELEAEKTERGLVLTLSEVLFDVGEATLKEGGQRTVGQLATFLQQYPERRVLVEGHTDTTGSLELNLDLSRRRAEAVRVALMEMGISADRVGTVGLGPSHPVAGNETAAGRQQNRRVEIIISDDDGVISER